MMDLPVAQHGIFCELIVLGFSRLFQIILLKLIKRTLRQLRGKIKFGDIAITQMFILFHHKNLCFIL